MGFKLSYKFGFYLKYARRFLNQKFKKVKYMLIKF